MNIFSSTLCTVYKISGLPFAHATNKETFFHLSTNANGNFGSGVISVNGRIGVTPEFPNGTYYYIITDEFPGIPRYFKGIPSNDFRLGGG